MICDYLCLEWNEKPQAGEGLRDKSPIAQLNLRRVKAYDISPQSGQIENPRWVKAYGVSPQCGQLETQGGSRPTAYVLYI